MSSQRRAISITGSTPQTNTVRNRERRTFSVIEAGYAMGIDWMTMKGLSQAIPPAYSRFIAEQFLMQHQPGPDGRTEATQWNL